MSTTTLVANLGGMMGLCIGLSFVSVVEMGLLMVQLALAVVSKKG